MKLCLSCKGRGRKPAGYSVTGDRECFACHGTGLIKSPAELARELEALALERQQPKEKPKPDRQMQLPKRRLE